MVAWSTLVTLSTLAFTVVRALPATDEPVDKRTLFGICDPLGILGSCPTGQTCSIITHTCFGCGQGSGFPFLSSVSNSLGLFCDNSLGSFSIKKRTFLPPCQPSSCQTCPAGQYSAAGQSNCLQCPVNTYSAAGSSSCTSCPGGQTSAAGSASCIPTVLTCSPGSFLQGQSCSTCPPGQYSASGTVTSCSVCPSNTFSGFGAAACTPCQSGYVSAPGSGSSSFCTALSCAPGQYVSGTSCSTCPGGQFSTGSTVTSCTTCPANTYSNANAGVCTPCPTGYTSSVGSSGLASCIPSPCSAGSYLNPNTMTCAVCPGGQYTSTSNTASQCNVCQPGTYSTNGATSCTNCPAGQSSYTANDVCYTCPSGQTSLSGGLCGGCAAGSYLDTSSNSCKTCPGGQFSNAGTSGQCSVCPAGTYSPNGASSCTTCPDGQISYAGNNACQSCSNGLTSNSARTTCVPKATGGMSSPKKRSDVCVNGFAKCPIEKVAGYGGFECVDVKTDLQSCGGCWSTGEGVDCSAFDPLATATCVSGTCHYACPRGYFLTETGCEKNVAQRNRTMSLLKTSYRRVILSV